VFRVWGRVRAWVRREQDPGIVQEAAGDLEPSLHASREVLDEVVLPTVNSTTASISSIRLPVSLWSGCRDSMEPEVLIGREAGIERRVLKDEADRGADLVRLPYAVVSGDGRRASCGREQGAQDVDGRGLARAVGPRTRRPRLRSP